MKRRSPKASGGRPVPLSDAVQPPAPDRLVDGVPVKTYRGASLAEVAPIIRAELGDGALILRQREGVTGGIAGFFAKRMVEIDVALVDAPGAPALPSGGRTRIDTVDGPAIGPGDRLLSEPATPPVTPTVATGRSVADALAEDLIDDAPDPIRTSTPGVAGGFEPFTPPAAPLHQPVQPVAAFPPPIEPPAVPHAPAAPSAPGAATPGFGMERGGQVPAQPRSAGAFNVTAPSIEQARSIEAALRAEQERARELQDSTADVGMDAPFDPGQSGVAPAPVPQTGPSFEERLRTAGLVDPMGPPDPAHVLAPMHEALVRRGLPEQIASPIVDDTLCHRVALEPAADLEALLASELARRIPTAPLVGRAGQAVAFVGSSGVGKTRAIARLAAAYGAAARIPVACVTLQDSGGDGLLASALAPFGVAVHSAPDAPRALDRITALRRHSLVLVDTPGVSPGDRVAVDRLAATLQLLELDTVALCLPVTLAAPIARRVLRALRPLRPTALVATHADEADLLGGVVAVAIDRRVPLAYVSAGAGRGSIVGADAHRIASDLLAAAEHLPPAPPVMPSGRTVALPDVRRPLESDVPARPSTPTVDVAAGASHLAPPWITPSLRDRRG